MPVDGIKSKCAKDLKFSVPGTKVVVSTFIAIGLIFMSILCVAYLIMHPFKLENIDAIIFFCNATMEFSLFMVLAHKWPRLMRKWEATERSLPKYQTQVESALASRKIRMIALVFFPLSLLDHLLNNVSVMYYNNFCGNISEGFELFFTSQLKQISFALEYTTWKAIVIEIVSIIATFVSSYVDVFVMVVCIGISERFQQVNRRIIAVKRKVTTPSFWIIHRNYYESLCILCKDLDNAISPLVTVSCSNNLYFICVQLIRSLGEKPTIAHTIYFWYSLFFLIGRTLSVFVHSARINDESKRPASVFRCIPKESWCPEVKRFSTEVNEGMVALSALKLFHITRGFVSKTLGSVITYATFLMQFQSSEKQIAC